MGKKFMFTTGLSLCFESKKEEFMDIRNEGSLMLFHNELLIDEL